MAGNVSSVGLGEPMVEQRLLQGTDVALASLLLGWMPIDGSAEPLGHGIMDLGMIWRDGGLLVCSMLLHVEYARRVLT